MNYIIAWYEVDQEYGGPEEGGWWYYSGRKIREFRRRFQTEGEAFVAARRANRLIRSLQRSMRAVESVLYSGGRYEADVYPVSEGAPEYYPERRPHYE